MHSGLFQNGGFIADILKSSKQYELMSHPTPLLAISFSQGEKINIV